MRKTLFGLALLALTGCQETRESATDDLKSRICLTPPQPTQGDWAGCIHRWAYRLAVAPGSHREIAEAAVNGCADAIAWQVNESAEGVAEQAAGNPDKLLTDINDSAQRLAHFHVIQARAGKCDPP